MRGQREATNELAMFPVGFRARYLTSPYLTFTLLVSSDCIALLVPGLHLRNRKDTHKGVSRFPYAPVPMMLYGGGTGS